MSWRSRQAVGAVGEQGAARQLSRVSSGHQALRLRPAAAAAPVDEAQTSAAARSTASMPPAQQRNRGGDAAVGTRSGRSLEPAGAARARGRRLDLQLATGARRRRRARAPAVDEHAHLRRGSRPSSPLGARAACAASALGQPRRPAVGGNINWRPRSSVARTCSRQLTGEIAMCPGRVTRCRARKNCCQVERSLASSETGFLPSAPALLHTFTNGLSINTVTHPIQSGVATHVVRERPSGAARWAADLVAVPARSINTRMSSSALPRSSFSASVPYVIIICGGAVLSRAVSAPQCDVVLAGHGPQEEVQAPQQIESTCLILPTR